MGNHKERAALPYWLVAGLLLLAMGYNAPLAFVNEHIHALGFAQVAATEFFILLLGGAVVLSRGLGKRDEPCVVLGAAFFLVAVLLSFINGGLVIEAFRNVAIIVLFTMLGIRSDERGVRIAFAVAIGLVLAVMLYELLARESYAALFNPFNYYHNTRGLGEVDYEDSGMFGNALGYEGRFSYGLFNNPRTSSLFLEQTSLANFISVVAVYLLTMWPRLSRAERMLGVAFIILAIISNNARLASIFAPLTLVGFFVYPRLARYGTLILPLVMLGLAIFMTSVAGPADYDAFVGRIGVTVHLLSLTDLPASLGARAFETGQFPDSGYSYVLYSSSLAGAIILWLYVALIVPFRSDMQRRCAWGLGVFFFMNLLIAGNAVFSVKVAAPLWLLAGLMRSPGFYALPTPRSLVRNLRAPRGKAPGAAPAGTPASIEPAPARAGAARRWSRAHAHPAGWRTQ